MKKQIMVGAVLFSMVVSSIVIANPAINKAHTGKKGADDAAVNCVYCHTKAAIEKKAGQDKAALQKGANCALAGCHK